VGVKITKHSSGDVIIEIPGQEAGEAMSGIQNVMIKVGKV
jgi:uncharacterized FlaG/YvyC family protein